MIGLVKFKNLELNKILFLVVLFALGTALSACSGGGGKRSTSKKTTVAEEPTVEEPTDTTNTNPKDVGVEVGEVDETTGVSFETGNEPKLVHLVVKADDEKKDSKHTSEFLLMVRADKDTCLSVKIRPGTAIADEVDEDAIRDAVEADNSTCDGAINDIVVEGEEEEAAEEDAALAFHLSNSSESSFNLAENTNNENNTLCDQRTFRMETLPAGVEAGEIDIGGSDIRTEVRTTTATLAAKSASSKIKIWVDTEFAESTQICSGGVVQTNVPSNPVPYRSAQDVPNYISHGDSLFQTQLQKLADVAENILSSMTTSFGEVSDLDGNGAVNIYISPQVNRLHFLKTYSKYVDNFQALPVYKPGDLAPLNIQENPASNEGEVVYLWAPSPSGVYNYQIYPSSNSLNTNYAYGFVSYQLMSLIMNKAKLMDGEGSVVEEEFVRESLSYLASIYYAGGSYSWREISHYLSGYTPYLSLTERFDPDKFTKAAKIEGISGQLGMRALFGWYLHNQLCGTTDLTPCAKVASLVTSKSTGTALISDALGMPWLDVLDHFGSSLPMGLLEDPTTAITTANSALDGSLPDLIEFKHFQTLNPTGTANTGVEHDSNLVGMGSTTRNEPSYFSPYPNKKHMPFRVMSPNNDIELKMRKNSLAYIILTGVTSEYTDITSFVGKGIKVTAVPIGNRDLTKRAVYSESLSRDGILDTRPIKLFQDAAPTVAPPLASFVWESVDSIVEDENFVVSVEKEAWINGEINNSKINVEGALTEIGDSDTYLLKVDPCATGDDDGGGTSTITGCSEADEFEVLVQLYVNPGEGRLEPLLSIMPQDRRAYHGAVAWPDRTTIDPSFTPVETNVEVKHSICPAAIETDAGGAFTSDFDTDTFVDPSCQMNRVAFADSSCNGWDAGDIGSPRKECFPSESSGATFVADALMHEADSTPDGIWDFGYAFRFDNFLYQGLGFPFDTTDSIVFWGGANEDTGLRMFTAEEKNRMFYNFNFNQALIPNYYEFHAARFGFSDRRAVGEVIAEGAFIDEDWQELEDEQIADLVNTVRHRMENDADEGGVLLAEEDPFIEVCTGFNIAAETCRLPCENAAAISAGITTFLVENKSFVVCNEEDSVDCIGRKLFEDYTGVPACSITAGDLTLGNFFENAYPDAGGVKPAQERFIWVVPTGNELATYYKSVEPKRGDGGRCSGGAGVMGEEYAVCDTFVHDPMGEDDIRNQLWMNATRVKVNASCSNLLYPDEFGYCSDKYSFNKSVGDAALVDPPAYSCSEDEGGITDETRETKGMINFRSGEVYGLPDRIYPINFKVKGDRATVIPIMVGGLQLSQGKYMIRVRTFKKSQCKKLPS